MMMSATTLERPARLVSRRLGVTDPTLPDDQPESAEEPDDMQALPGFWYSRDLVPRQEVAFSAER